MGLPSWTVIYYEKTDGGIPVEEFIESRTQREKVKIFNWIEQLEQHGPHLPRPFADLLEGGIHELRIKVTGDQARILYFFCFREFIVLTHGFIKTTAKVPPSEIGKAIKYREDFLRRYNENAIRRSINENL